MTVPKALPPGVDHRAATEALANATEANVKAGIAQQAAPRPAGPKANVSVEVPVKTSR
ncbi:hypothetical protein [Bradyrhizobium pachyrhizi]|uniref:hypothetical protein n=1 Tax=Bradyrhizobium pachyrhizi TaxID=280333 RepID=UPI003D36A475